MEIPDNWSSTFTPSRGAVVRLYLLLYLLVAVSLLCSQELPPQEIKTLGRIEGRTVNAVTGEPLGDVSLTLRALPPGSDSLIVQSDADGQFSFEGMEPGSYILSATRLGSPNEVYSVPWQRVGGTSLTLAAGQVLKEIEFRLTPLGSISGAVVDDKGKPMPALLVTLVGGNPKFSGHAPTDGAGEFRFTGLRPGSYVLVGVPAAPASGGKPEKTQERLLPTYYPSAADEAGAVPVQLAPGQQLSGLTIVLRKGRLYHVRGTVVTSSAEAPLADVRLSLMPRTQADVVISSSSAGAAPKPDGSFDVGELRPGAYYLTAQRSGRIGIRITNWRDSPDSEVTGLVVLGRVPVDVIDEDLSGVVLRIGGPLQIRGTMRMEGEDKPDLTGVLIQLILLGTQPGNLSRAPLDAENAFTLKDVSPGKHTIVVSGLPQNAYVKSIRMGGLETVDSGLDLTYMESVPPLEILISPNAATVEGTAKGADDKPAPGAWVCLVPDPARPELMPRFKYATARGDGRFTFAGVAPGEYRLYAFEQPQWNALVNPGFFKPFESKAVKLTIREGDRKQADVQLLKPGSA